MKVSLFAVACAFAAGLLANPEPEKALPDAYAVQLSFLSPGFTCSEEGLGTLSLLEFGHSVKAKLSSPRHGVVYCPVDVGLAGSISARTTWTLAANVFWNALADGKGAGYRQDGVVPSRETCTRAYGLHASGLMNAFELAAGVDLAGVGNSASYFSGVQVAGVANHVFDAQGVQVAGLANMCDYFRGVQIGLMNVSGEGGGLQVGLLNAFTGRATGLQIGLVNKNVNGGLLPLVNLAY